MICMAVQMCAKDAEAGIALLDLICDLWEPVGVSADLMLVLGPGVVIARSKIERWSRYFDGTSLVVCSRPDAKWPVGPNFAARDAWRAFLQQGRCDSLWLIEPDSVPTRFDFFSRVVNEWASRPDGRHVMGFWTQSPHPTKAHINGNCIIHRRFAEVCPQFLNSPELERTAWDHVYREAMCRWGWPSREIASVHGWGENPKKPWTNPDAVFLPLALPAHHPLGETQEFSWLHGTKCWQEAQQAVRRRLLAGG